MIGNRVILFGFNEDKIHSIMKNENIVKLIIFDYDDLDIQRNNFEKLYSFYKDKITFYDGDVCGNCNSYLQMRDEEGILIDNHEVIISPGFKFKN